MKTRRRLAFISHPLGSFGLLLVGLVGRLADHASPSNRADDRGAKAFLARRAIDAIAIVGWTVDRLGDWMSPAGSSERRGVTHWRLRRAGDESPPDDTPNRSALACLLTAVLPRRCRETGLHS